MREFSDSGRMIEKPQFYNRREMCNKLQVIFTLQSVWICQRWNLLSNYKSMGYNETIDDIQIAIQSVQYWQILLERTNKKPVSNICSNRSEHWTICKITLGYLKNQFKKLLWISFLISRCLSVVKRVKA